MKLPPAVVIPADRPAALGIARSLGARGIPVYAIDGDPAEIGMVSRYVTPRPLPASCRSENDRLQFLLALGKELGGESVLFPVSDDSVLLCSEFREDLRQYYRYVMPEHQTVRDLLTKDGLHQIAQRLAIADPMMLRVGSRLDLQKLAPSFPFPAILKPVYSPSWLRPEIVSMLRTEPLSGPPKVALCRNADELLETYDRLCPYDDQLIVQEVIPGDDNHLVYLCFYLDRDSRTLALFAGEKLRVLPVGFGSATYVRSFRDPDLEQVGLKLLSGTRYQGLGGVEFKKDARDNCYKLVEFNVRLGMWDSYGGRCGVDIPYIAYRDALGERVGPETSYREGVFWIDLQRDIRAFLIYRKQGRLSFAAWIRSLLVEKEWAVFAASDWKPAVVALLKLFQRPWNRLRQSLPFRRGTHPSSGAGDGPTR